MKKRIGAWKRRKSKDKRDLVLSEYGSVSSPVGVTGAHYLRTSTSSAPAPMHFHFSNANFSFATNEKDSNGTPSISETALKGCDLTMSSSISTHSGVKTGNVLGNNLMASRRSIDPPESEAKLHYSDSRSGSSHTGSESSIKRRERKARMLPPSRVLNGHVPEEWPPSDSSSAPVMINGRDNVQLRYKGPDSGSYFTGSESSSSIRREQKARLLTPSRVLRGHTPEEWPPSESTSSDSSSSRHDKENNGWVSNQYQNQCTRRHSNIGIKQQPIMSQPGQLYDDEHNSVDSNPPPDFHPRKEIVHAVKCHEEMGRALSKLALNTEINSTKFGANYSVTSTALTGASTFETFSTDSFRFEAMHSRLNDQRSVHQRNYVSSTGAPNTWSYSDEIGWSGSASSASVSAKSDGSSFFQHVSFLEGLEEHIKTYTHSESISDHRINSDVPDEDATFFPTFDDLRSPPSGNVPSKYSGNSFSSETISQSVLSQTPQSDIRDIHSLSPPKTPSLICSFSNSAKMNNPLIDGEAILQGISQIKEETTTMLNGLESKLKSDLRELLEKEVVQIKSIVSEKSHNMSSEPEQKCRANSSFTDASSRFSPSKISTRNAMTPPPQPNTSLHTVDRNVLSEVIQKSMRSMESSILDKITTHMNKDASHQRAYLEEMIDEKVTKVMVGQNLEMQMAMGEMKRAAKKLAKQSSSRPVVKSDANAVITPARHLTPIKHVRNGTPSSDSKQIPTRAIKREPSIKVLEDSFADTMKVIDDFVLDCDGLVSDFDKIAFKMEDSSDAD